MTVPAFDSQGRPVPVHSALGRGGEGEVYAVAGEPGLAAKILYPTRRRHGKYEKLEAMVARPPAGAYDLIEGFPVLTWPRTLLHQSARPRGLKTFQGYVMARVHPHDFVPFYRITTPARRLGLGGNPVTWDKALLLGMRLCHLVRTLHQFGYAVGDMNDRNVLVSRRFTPLLMDVDSFQVPRPRWGHFASVVGDQLFWPPELLDTDLSNYKGSRVQGDRYALAILLFQLFMGGFRPYQARGSTVAGLESLVEKTRAGHFPWSAPRPGVLEPPAGAPDFRSLPRAIRARFEEAFVKGHRRPASRPSAQDWYQTLHDIHRQGFQPCARDANHVYSRKETRCPWCADANNPYSKPKARPARRPSVATRRSASKARLPRPKSPPPMRAARARVATPTLRRAARKAPPPKRAAQKPRSSWPRRGLWMAGLVAAFATPTWFLRQLPVTFEKTLATALVTTVVLMMSLTAIAWPWLGAWQQRAIAAAVALVPSAGMAALLVRLEWWSGLDYTTGAASLAAGMMAFVLLERNRPQAFRPRPIGWIHGAVSVPVSYLPTGLIWVWTRV